MRDDETFMRRALELAASVPFTTPNPKVGAVLVRDGNVIAEGAHQGAGSPHAEVVALQAADARGACLYVNLEPCAHQGRTPPCAPAVVAAGVARVVVAMDDPDPRVAGAGIALLQEAGVEVDVGLLEDAARELNAPYVRQRTTGRPYVTLKLALTLDGRLAARDGSARWITGEATRRVVHERRRQADAVLIGAGTALADDPSLTVRHVTTTRQPAAVVVDATGRVPPTLELFRRPGALIVATTPAVPHERQIEWKEAGAEVLVLPDGDGGVDLDALFEQLGGRGFLEVYCEGGAELATSLLRHDLVQRLELHYGPVLAGRGGPDLGDLGIGTLDEAHRWRTTDVVRQDSDILVTLRRT